MVLSLSFKPYIYSDHEGKRGTLMQNVKAFIYHSAPDVRVVISRLQRSYISRLMAHQPWHQAVGPEVLA